MQDELSLRWLDYGARMYMADIGRWNGVDSEASGYLQLSPYVYVDNDPVHNVDPDGNIIWYGRYARETRKTIRYLARNSPSVRRDINRLRWSFKITRIDGAFGSSGTSEYNPTKLVCDPYRAQSNSKGEFQSPAVRLAHEIHHAVEGLRNKDYTDPHSKLNTEINPETGTKSVEEKTVEHERKVVGEINNNNRDGSPEAKRNSHADNGNSKPVADPTSNDPLSRRDKKVIDRVKKIERLQ